MIRYLTGTIFFIGLMLCTATSEATPQNSQMLNDDSGRYALVIGGEMSDRITLKTPINNATDVAWALHNAGFSVTLSNDADNSSPEAIMTCLSHLAFQLSKNPDNIGVVYFSGDSDIFSIYLSALMGEEALNKQPQIGYDPSKCDFLLAYIAQCLPSTNRLNVIIADANFKHSFPCRYSTTNKKIPIIPLKENTIFFSAAQPEKTHAEGTGRNSPFTTQLLKVLDASDLSLIEIIQSVSDQVHKSTRNKQQPWHSTIQKAGLEKEILIPQKVREWANQMNPVSDPQNTQFFRDCPDCPEMVMVPPGRFMMGSPGTEPGQTYDTPGYRREGPQHSVTIPQAFAIGKYEVTLAEFNQFATETGFLFRGCDAWLRTHLGAFGLLPYQSDSAGMPFRPYPGYAQASDHPVACICLPDAQAYIEWLSKKTGKKYRLPTEAEWEYAARAGTRSSRFWGDKSDSACRYANVADRSLKRGMPGRASYQMHKCSEGYAATSPVGSFEPNQFGLYDTIGNVWEWTTTRWTFAGHRDFNKWLAIYGSSGSHSLYILKGGSWNTPPKLSRSAYRIWDNEGERYFTYGFRVVRDR